MPLSFILPDLYNAKKDILMNCFHPYKTMLDSIDFLCIDILINMFLKVPESNLVGHLITSVLNSGVKMVQYIMSNAWDQITCGYILPLVYEFLQASSINFKRDPSD